MQQSPDINAVLHENGLVEAIFLAQLLVTHGIDAALAGEGLDRVSGNEADQEESDQRDPDEGRDDEADAGQNEPEHCAEHTKKAEQPELPRRRPKLKPYLPLMSTP